MVEFDVASLLQRLIYNHPQAWAALQESRARWPCRGADPSTLADISDGSFCRSHPELGVDAEDDGSMRLAFGLYNDGIEVVNPLGAFIGRHHIDVYYLQIFNLPPDVRQSFDNILLVAIALSDDVKYYGHEQILTGTIHHTPPTATYRECTKTGTSLLSSMSRLDLGLNLFVDSVDKHGYEPQVFRGWIVVSSLDYLAAAAIVGSKGSTAAHHFCRDCNADSSSESYPLACSFIDGNDDLLQPYELNTFETRTAHKQQYDAARTNAARQEVLNSAGLNSFVNVLTLFPGLEESPDCAPQDLAHNTGGALRYEIAWSTFTFIRRRKFFTLKQWQDRVR